MINETELNTDLLDNAIEITEELIRAINIVSDVVIRYNENPIKTDADTQHLHKVVDNFNFDQKYKAVKVKCSTPTELLNQFIKRRIVPQIKVVRHSSNKLYGIEFHTHFLGFQDFYNSNSTAFPQFTEFCHILSSFLHNVHEELTKSNNHNNFFPNYPYHVTGKDFHFVESKNPYPSYFLPTEWTTTLDLSNVSSYNKLNKIFTPIISTYFPDINFRFLCGSTWPFLFLYMKDCHRFENTLDYILCLVWHQVHFRLEAITPDYSHQYHSISRHIAWCEHEHKRKCLKFNFDCHSSVNCPFYRESQLKKQGRIY